MLLLIFLNHLRAWDALLAFCSPFLLAPSIVQYLLASYAEHAGVWREKWDQAECYVNISEYMCINIFVCTHRFGLYPFFG